MQDGEDRPTMDWLSAGPPCTPSRARSWTLRFVAMKPTKRMPGV